MFIHRSDSIAPTSPISASETWRSRSTSAVAREDDWSGLVATITAPTYQGSRPGPSAASDPAARRHYDRLPPAYTTPPSINSAESACPALQKPADNTNGRRASTTAAMTVFTSASRRRTVALAPAAVCAFGREQSIPGAASSPDRSWWVNCGWRSPAVDRKYGADLLSMDPNSERLTYRASARQLSP